MTKIRAAIRSGLPPVVMWGGEREWNEKGYLLIEAFQIYEDSLCGGCGQSGMHALEVANTREFTTDTTICLGCNVRESWQANNSDHKIKGLKLFVVNSMGQDGAVDG